VWGGGCEGEHLVAGVGGVDVVCGVEA
jgi:hypothetical protein